MTILLVLAVLVTAFALRRNRWLALAAVLLVTNAVMGPVAAADDAAVQAVQLSALTVSLIVALLVPLITGVVTRYSTSSGVKGLITLVLNAGQALVVNATVADGTAIISRETFVAFSLSLAISIATYAGVYRPLGVTSSTPTGALTNIGVKDS